MASELAMQLGRRIRELRKARLYTQEELAEQANIGVSYLSMIERAERVPHLSTLSLLANALGVTLSQLFLDLDQTRGAGQKPMVPASCLSAEPEAERGKRGDPGRRARSIFQEDE
jgi:transcriptional regulator with XRE-family HTH domain